MQTVDLADGRFLFDGDPRFIGTPLEEPPETFEFATAIELQKSLLTTRRNRALSRTAYKSD